MVKMTPSVKASTFEASCELFTVARVARRRLRNGFLCYHIWQITTRHDDQTPSPSQARWASQSLFLVAVCVFCGFAPTVCRYAVSPSANHRLGTSRHSSETSLSRPCTGMALTNLLRCAERPLQCCEWQMTLQLVLEGTVLYREREFVYQREVLPANRTLRSREASQVREGVRLVLVPRRHLQPTLSLGFGVAA